MKNKLITLFGGGGFVGRYAAQALLAAGARVRIAQREPRQAWFLKTQGGLGQTQFIAADLMKPSSVARAIEGADGVVNLVGSFTNMAAINGDGARRIAEAAAAAGASTMVHVSAIGADPASPAAYGRTKAAGEAGVRESFPDATILRPSVVFGREDQFTNRFAGMLARAPLMPVLRGGARFQPVYVRDVADAIVVALADPGAHAGRTYELGGPDVLSLREIYGALADAIGRHPPMIDLPDAAGALIAMVPGGPLTGDQWKMLGRDTVVGADAKGLAALGITPTPMASVLSEWLVRYRRHGRFTKRQTA